MNTNGKLILVEPKVLNRHRRNPLVNVMEGLDKEMMNVLQREDLNADEKVKYYQQLLQRYRIYDDKYDNRSPKKVHIVKQTDEKKTENDILDNLSSETVEEDILDSVPKSMKEKAKSIINKIKRGKDMGWNDSGEMIYKGETYKGTNIVDLVNDVLRKRKNVNPEGWKIFSTGLKEINIPKELIGHEDRWHFMNKRTVAKEPTFVDRSENDSEIPQNVRREFFPKFFRWENH